MITNTVICSQCCGITRQHNTCESCAYYQDSRQRRNYGALPKYPVQAMEDNSDLEDYANSIESALCAFDALQEYQIKDGIALRILELLLDKYHFTESSIDSEDNLVTEGFRSVDSALKEDFPDISNETISKVTATIYFVAKRRSEGHREYIDFIHEYIGERVGKGIRAIKKGILSKE